MRTTLVTGGAGFVGTNMTDRLLEQGERVVVLDDLSAPGAADNLLRLRARYGARLEVDVADVRDPAAVRRTVRGATGVYHLLDEPEGALVLLEEARRRRDPPPVLFRAA